VRSPPSKAPGLYRGRLFGEFEAVIGKDPAEREAWDCADEDARALLGRER